MISHCPENKAQSPIWGPRLWMIQPLPATTLTCSSLGLGPHWPADSHLGGSDLVVSAWNPLPAARPSARYALFQPHFSRCPAH